MQPVEWVGEVIRFKRNRIVRDALDFATAQGDVPGVSTPYQAFNMNVISDGVREGKYTVEEYEQFCQLIGYSVSGFGDLSMVRPETVQQADDEADALIVRTRMGRE